MNTAKDKEMEAKAKVISVSSRKRNDGEAANALSREPAELQLLSDSQSAPPGAIQKPSGSAILAASLLNANRRPTTRSSAPAPKRPADVQGAAGRESEEEMVRRKKARLSTPNYTFKKLDLTEGNRIPESPERNVQGSPVNIILEKVNRKPIKRTKKGNNPKVVANFKSRIGKTTDNAREDVVESSPPPTLPTTNEPTVPRERRSRRVAGDEVELDVDLGKATGRPGLKIKPKAQDPVSEKERTSKSPRRNTEDRGHEKAGLLAEEGASNPSTKKHGSNLAIPDTRKAGRPGKPPKNISVDQEPHREDGYDEDEDGDGDGDNDAEEQDLLEPQANADPEEIVQEPNDAGDSDDTEESDDAEEPDDAEASDDADDPEGTGGSMTLVFGYLNWDKPTWKCQTSEVRSIAQVCREALKTLASHPGPTIETVSSTTKNLQDILHTLGQLEETAEERLTVKLDAYGRLFRLLVKYLKKLHDWLREQLGDITQSLEALCIITPFMKRIISFLDETNSWKVVIPKKFARQCLIKDVRNSIIPPLRCAHNEYQNCIRNLQLEIDKKRYREETRRNLEAQLCQRQAKEIRDKKWTIWKYLHTWRMDFELDLDLRDNLSNNKELFNMLLEQPIDRDANGETFERVPVFRPRDSPPGRRSLLFKELWTEDELNALLGGLKDYLCSPSHSNPDYNVFYYIFRDHCGPRGALRYFTAPQITEKAAWLRFQLMKKFRAEAWEIPEWIGRIPVLP